ncbi:MAG TPA: head-tail connector protein [Rhizobiaceae bacterium]|nr:head-tail connector protein [Rhizobiaceae bacterium]
MLSPVRTIAPAVPVVTLAEVRQMLHVDHQDDDHLLQSLIDAAHSHLDGYSGILGRALITQTWQQDFKDFTCEPLRLPLKPIQEVSTVTYYDGSNDEQELDDTVWQLLTDASGSYLALQADQSWPGVYGRSDAVRVTYVAGYGDAASDVPAALHTAIILYVQMHYDPESRASLKPAFDALVGPFWNPSI